MSDKKETIEGATKIGVLLSDSEKEALWDLAMKSITVGGLAIEIGTWKGGSAAIIGEVCRQKIAKLICIDYFHTNIEGVIPFEKVEENLQGLPVNYLVGKSTEVFKYLKDGIADFIFIDGGHSFSVAKLDLINYFPKLKSIGVFCGHDYNDQYDVKKAVDKVFGRENITLHDSIWVKN